MKYLFVGLGSIGQRHLQNLRKISPDEQISVVTSSKEKGRELKEKYGVEVFYTLEEGLKGKPDAVFITNPTSLHIPTAIIAAKAKCHLFIEKPISHNLKDVKKLYRLTEFNKKVCFVGFNYRYHPNLELMKKLIESGKIGRPLFCQINVGQYLPDWHPLEDYRKSYAARKELGGGVLLTLIHELDYAYWLVGKPISLSAYLEKVSNLDIDAEDIASIIMKTEKNIVVEVHMDYLHKPLRRTCEIEGEKGNLIWDFSNNKVIFFDKNCDTPIEYVSNNFERNNMYEREILHFISCIKSEEEPKVSKKQVIDVMEIVAAAKKSAKYGKRINLGVKNEHI